MNNQEIDYINNLNDAYNAAILSDVEGPESNIAKFLHYGHRKRRKSRKISKSRKNRKSKKSSRKNRKNH